MDTKFKNGDVFLRGFAYPTEWIVVNIKLINDIVHYELKDVRSPKSVVLLVVAIVTNSIILSLVGAPAGKPPA